LRPHRLSSFFLRFTAGRFITFGPLLSLFVPAALCFRSNISFFAFSTNPFPHPIPSAWGSPPCVILRRPETRQRRARSSWPVLHSLPRAITPAYFKTSLFSFTVPRPGQRPPHPEDSTTSNPNPHFRPHFFNHPSSPFISSSHSAMLCAHFPSSSPPKKAYGLLFSSYSVVVFFFSVLFSFSPPPSGGWGVCGSALF